MRIFVAGATGAIGRPLIAELIRQGHTVTGMTRSDVGAQGLEKLGASVARASALDATSVRNAMKQSGAEIVIDQLTSLPANPSEIATALPVDRHLRIEGGANLLGAAVELGVLRYIQQSSGFFLQSSDGLANEAHGMAVDASPNVSVSARTYAELESRLASNIKIEALILRYGFFYGPNTWYCADGACADQARRREIYIIGRGEGVWSWVHIDEAASATVAALNAPAGIYNIVDDDPSPVRVWLPAFAKSVGAPQPPRISEDEARGSFGEDAVFYGTKLCGASNEKAKRTLNFKPRRLEWLS